jgi:hypothetical protein
MKRWTRRRAVWFAEFSAVRLRGRKPSRSALSLLAAMYKPSGAAHTLRDQNGVAQNCLKLWVVLKLKRG